MMPPRQQYALHVPPDAGRYRMTITREENVANFGSKTILAIAIAAAAAQNVQATDFNVYGQNRIEIASGNYDSINLTSNGLRAMDQGGVKADGPHIAGDFVSNSNFALNGAFVTGITIDDDSQKGAIGGSFINNGNINANGRNATGINVSDTVIGQDGVTNDAIGNFVNNGNIIVNDTSGLAATDAQGGIVLQHIRLAGDLINKGVMSVAAPGIAGIQVDGQDKVSTDTFKYARIDRDVINAGGINATGAGARGLELKMVNLGQDVENTGFINVNGKGAVALRLDRTDYNRIINTGKIHTYGEGSTGIEVRESFGNTVLDHAETAANGQDPQYLMRNGIVNEGTIVSEGTGIKITNDLLQTGPGETSNSDNFYRITQNSGLISGVGAAIDGNGQSDLYLNGGSIVGNIEGIRQAFVNGDVSVSSKLIEAKYLDVATGQLYVAEVTNVTGKMIVRNGAGVSVFVNDATDPSKGIISVDKKLTLEQGSVVGVTTNPGAFNKATTKYVLISAGELENLGAQVKSLTPLLSVTNVTWSSTNLTANVGLATGDQASGETGGNTGGDAGGNPGGSTGGDSGGDSGGNAGHSLTAIGVDRNGIAATKAFIDNVLSKLPTNSNLFQSFINADDSTLRRLASSLQPETNRSAQSLSLIHI